MSQPVPRHRDINDHLARHIISMLSNPSDEQSGEADDAEGVD
jgi:hypothetical protein